MARIRTIKPEFPHSESMGRVTRDARLLFIELWTIADDEGRTRGASRMLASLLFPYDNDAPELIDGWLSELEKENCIQRYSDEGNKYIQVINWVSHQKIDHPSKSKIPAFRDLSRGLAKRSTKLALDQGPRTKDRTKDQGMDQGALASEFEEFWRFYPTGRKSSKGKAREAWTKAITKKPAAEIIAAAKEYAESPVGKGQFVKGPAVWLNGECWDDDRASWNRRDTNGNSNGSKSADRVGPGQRFRPEET